MARDPERKKRKREDDEEVKPINVEDELAELEGAWDESEDKGDTFGDIPDNRYQTKVTKVEIAKSQSSGRLQIAWEFTIMTGEFKNRKKWAYDGLETKENFDYVKTRLARLGINVKKKKIQDLPELLEACVGLTCEVQVKTRGDFQNVYVNKLIDIDAEGDGGGDEDDWKPSKRSKDTDEDAEDDEPKKKSRRDDDDDADEDEPKKKSKSDEDEDDDADEDRPAKKSKREEADEDGDDDEPPAKKKAKASDDDDDADEDDDRPAKKSKSKDEDDDADEDDEPRRKKSKF